MNPPDDVPDGARILLAVSRLTAQKGIDVAIRALPSLPDDTVLVVLGEGPERAALEGLARELGVERRVFLPGRVPDVAAWLRRADVLVHPARWEGFGLGVLEAMLAGLPVVATRVSSLPELVVDGETGLLVRRTIRRHSRRRSRRRSGDRSSETPAGRARTRVLGRPDGRPDVASTSSGEGVSRATEPTVPGASRGGIARVAESSAASRRRTSGTGARRRSTVPTSRPGGRRRRARSARRAFRVRRRRRAWDVAYAELSARRRSRSSRAGACGTPLRCARVHAGRPTRPEHEKATGARVGSSSVGRPAARDASAS